MKLTCRIRGHREECLSARSFEPGFHVAVLRLRCSRCGLERDAHCARVVWPDGASAVLWGHGEPKDELRPLK